MSALFGFLMPQPIPSLRALRRRACQHFTNRSGRRGLLVAFEGPDGSGKTTQRKLFKTWLQSEGYDVVTTKWNSSDLIKPIIKSRKTVRALSPEEFSLLHGADFRHRVEQVILPALWDGKLVIASVNNQTVRVEDVVPREHGRDRTPFRQLERDPSVADDESPPEEALELVVGHGRRTAAAARRTPVRERDVAEVGFRGPRLRLASDERANFPGRGDHAHSPANEVVRQFRGFVRQRLAPPPTTPPPP